MSRYRGKLGAGMTAQAQKKIVQENKGFMNDKAIKGREKDMTQTHGGAYVFSITDEAFLMRFLITGSTGSFYASQASQMSEHIEFLTNIALGDISAGFKAIEMIETVSRQGRAVKNDSALFALAVMTQSAHVIVRQRAYAAVPVVARTATHLFMLMGFLKETRGFGRGLRRAINGWYLNRETQSLAYQIAKYRNREGWTHRDVLRVTRPQAAKMTDEQKALINYAVHPDQDSAIGGASQLSPVISAYEEMKRLPNNKQGIQRGLDLIVTHNLPHEVVPNDWKKEIMVWTSLLPSMNPEALLRNLGRMTSLSMFQTTNKDYLRNIEMVRSVFLPERLRSARLHPLKIYIAMKAYTSGTSRGGLSWSANKQILDILNSAFYNSFQYAPKTGKKIYLGLDVSGSMSQACYSPDGRTSQYGGYSHGGSGSISCHEAETIMARAITAVEDDFHVAAFSHKLVDVTETFDKTKDDIKTTVSKISRIPFGSTNLSLPMMDALSNPKLKNKAFDAFVIFTDNEVNIHAVHPAKLIADYRGKVGKPTRFIVVGMTANRISIADPKDPYMLDIGGFDSAIPKLLSEFISD